MKKILIAIVYFNFIFGSDFYADYLINDLFLVESIDQSLNDSLEIFANDHLISGYFTMPSARMPKSGMVRAGFSYYDPYKIYSLSLQYFDRIEFSGNYWEFNDRKKDFFSFPKDAEKTANVKFALLQKNDGLSFFPEIAIGWDNFAGGFLSSFYIVGTKEFLTKNVECSLGWGKGSIQGLFAGISWMPFRNFETVLKNLAFMAEYDARKDDEKMPLNYGIQCAFSPYFQFAINSYKKDRVAGKFLLQYPLGTTKGFLPKKKESVAETIAKNMKKSFIDRYKNLFKNHGLEIFSIEEKIINRKSVLRIKAVNLIYRHEEELKKKIAEILSQVIEKSIEKIIVVIDADALSMQEYQFRFEDLNRYKQGLIDYYTLSVLAPLQEVTPFSNSNTLYKGRRKIWIWTFRPQFMTYFGSNEGKLKYDVGVLTDLQGYLFYELYYDLQLNYFFYASSFDKRHHQNETKLYVVRSDTLKYLDESRFHVTKAFLQKNVNFFQGWYGRLAGGYFEMAYGGLSAELLYYPVQSNWAVGFECSKVWKRDYSGLGFQNVEKLNGKEACFFGLQYFLDLYSYFPDWGIGGKASVGKFLAKDIGARLELTRYFKSGFEFSFWFTATDAKDKVNDKIYYDKGVGFSIPLDFFLKKRSRTRVGYMTSAWLRDPGARSETGKKLYPILFYERNR